MIKNRYVVISVCLMLAMVAVAFILLPKIEVTSVQTKATYEEDVFNQTEVATVDITLDEVDLEDILANPTEETMVRANVTFNGKEVTDVGFRIKGNMTLRNVAEMEDSDRYSFKIDFDYYDDSKNLYGLKKLNLNNNYSDSTMAREYLSYQLMETMGIATPANSYMYVTINGQDWGLYLGVEAIEETFLEQNFADGTGDLYKPDGVGSDLAWISDDIDDYTGLNLKTNESSSDQSSMMAFLDAINNDGDLEEVMDVDEMLRYFAANTALVNLDHYQGSMKHNYYLYEEDGIFSILPWDYNMSFGGFGAGGGGGGNQPARHIDTTDEESSADDASNEGAAQEENTNQRAANANLKADGNKGGGMMSGSLINESSINFSITTPVSGTTLEDRPLLDALLSVDEYREQYYAYLEEIATTFFTESNISEITNQLTALLLPYVEKDPTKFSTTDEFLEGMSGENSLVEFSVQRAESILAQLSGDLVVEAETSSGPGGGNQGNMQSPPDMMDGENQGNLQAPPNMPDRENQGNMQAPPDVTDRENQGDSQPSANQSNGEKQANAAPPEMANRENQGDRQLQKMNDGNQQIPDQGGIRMESAQSYSIEQMITIAVTISLLILMTVFVIFFKRRRF